LTQYLLLLLVLSVDNDTVPVIMLAMRVDIDAVLVIIVSSESLH